MSTKEPLLLLRLNVIISDITDRVKTGAAEILEIVSKYEYELRLAKEEIHRQRQLLDAVVVPQQHTTLTSDVQCSDLQPSLHLSVCEQKIPPEQLLRDEEASQSNNPHVSVYSVALTNLQFEELTKSHQTGKEDDPYSCHEGDEFGRPLEAHDVSQIDLEQIKAEEKPMSISMGEECSTEDHTMTSNSSQSPSFKIERKTLSVRLHRIQYIGDGGPSSPGQQMEEKPLVPLIPTDGCQLPSRRSNRKLAVRTAVDGKTRASNAGFQKHLKIENQYDCDVPLSRDRGTCPICRRNLARCNLKRHMLIHTGEKQYNCKVCGRAFSRMDHLRNHTARHTHNNNRLNKPHMCSTFGQKYALERHKKMHAGEPSQPSHQRPISRKDFNRSSNLNAHMAKRKRVKKQKKPTFCAICQKDIYSCFKRHMMVHSGEKPHSCEFCGKQYSRKDHLRKHFCFTGTMS